jgi:hypothetical protein
LLNKADLKNWLHKDLERRDKLLLALATFDEPCAVKEILAACVDAGFRQSNGWNVSAILGASKGLAIRIPGGWEITDAGKQHLRNLGVTKLSPAAVQVATDLRGHLAKIKHPDTRAFVEEAVKCYEAELYRSSIVMAWAAAIHVLQLEIMSNHLSAFNTEAVRVDSRWKSAVNSDDFGRMKEIDFLDRIAAISAIDKNTKEELKKALSLRNSCGHPNSFKVSANAAANHIEILLLNVFDRFQA